MSRMTGMDMLRHLWRSHVYHMVTQPGEIFDPETTREEVVDYLEALDSACDELNSDDPAGEPMSLWERIETRVTLEKRENRTDFADFLKARGIEKCPACPSLDPASHKFSCSIGGARQPKFAATMDESGKIVLLGRCALDPKLHVPSDDCTDWFPSE
jgi:hypothetical protein